MRIYCQQHPSAGENLLSATPLCRREFTVSNTPLSARIYCQQHPSVGENLLSATTLCRREFTVNNTSLSARIYCQQHLSVGENPRSTTALCRRESTVNNIPLLARIHCQQHLSVGENPLSTTPLCRRESTVNNIPLLERIYSQQHPSVSKTNCHNDISPPAMLELELENFNTQCSPARDGIHDNNLSSARLNCQQLIPPLQELAVSNHPNSHIPSIAFRHLSPNCQNWLRH